MRGNVLNTLLQVCLQDLNWVQYLVSYCLYYVLMDKTSENSAKKGTYQSAYFWHFWTLAPLLNVQSVDILLLKYTPDYPLTFHRRPYIKFYRSVT